MAISSVGSNARNYPDLAAWIADLPATTTEQEVAELYNDSEFVSSATISISGITTTPSFNLVIRPATGEGFNDTEQALRYNPVNGVAIRKSNSYGSVILNSVANTEMTGIQLSTTTDRNCIGLDTTATLVFRDGIIESASNATAVTFRTTSGSSLINTVVVCNDQSSVGTEAVTLNYVSANIYNCTLITLFPSSTAFGIEKKGATADSSIVKNTGIFNFATALESGTWGAGTDYNGTDDATLPAGSNNQTSLLFADQFEDITTSTLDLRLKTGNDLDNNGTPDSVNTNDLDIFNNARSLTTPSIGAYETVSAGGVTISPDDIDNLQTIDQVTLTQHNILSINSLSQNQTIDQVTLTQNNQLSLNDISQVQTLDQISLTQAHLLVLNDLTMQQSLDQVSLTQNNILSIDDISQSQTIEQITLSTLGVVSVDGIDQNQTIEQITLGVSGVVSIDSFLQAQSLDIVTLTETGATLLSIANLSQEQKLNGVQLLQHSILSIDNLSNQQTIEAINFGGIVIGYLKGELSIIYAYNGDTMITNALTGETTII